MKQILFALMLIVSFIPGAAGQAAKKETAAGLPTARPEEVGMSSERLARIRVAMQRYIDRKEVPGVVTLVARRSRVVTSTRSATAMLNRKRR